MPTPRHAYTVHISTLAPHLKYRCEKSWYPYLLPRHPLWHRGDFAHVGCRPWFQLCTCTDNTSIEKLLSCFQSVGCSGSCGEHWITSLLQPERAVSQLMCPNPGLLSLLFVRTSQPPVRLVVGIYVLLPMSPIWGLSGGVVLRLLSYMVPLIYNTYQPQII